MFPPPAILCFILSFAPGGAPDYCTPAPVPTESTYDASGAGPSDYGPTLPAPADDDPGGPTALADAPTPLRFPGYSSAADSVCQLTPEVCQ